MGLEGDDKSHKVVDMGKVERVCHAFRFDDEQTLEGVDNFLNLFPLVGTFLHLRKVSFDDLINPFVLLDEDK